MQEGDQKKPFLPNYTGIKSGDDFMINIGKRMGSTNYSILMPNNNLAGYLHNDGMGNLIWDNSPSVGGGGVGNSGQISFYTGIDHVLSLLNNTYVLVNPPTTLLNTNDFIFSMEINGRIRYTAIAPKYYKIILNLTIHTLASNKVLIYTIQKNNTTPIFSNSQHHNNQEPENISLNFITLLSQNDFIELYIKADGNYDCHIISYNLILDPC